MIDNEEIEETETSLTNQEHKNRLKHLKFERLKKNENRILKQKNK
jgi:hypothetical protein